jgi:serine/threonine-protein kinase
LAARLFNANSRWQRRESIHSPSPSLIPAQNNANWPRSCSPIYVGSTQLKYALGEREAVGLIKRHHALIREILSQFSEGAEIETGGDSFLILFPKPSDAVKFALSAQRKLRAFAPEAHGLADRMGIHVGEALIERRADSAKAQALSGIHVDTCARVMALAQGGQILLTRFAFDNARTILKGEEIEGVGALTWMNHGAYVLKGVEEPVEICEVGETGAPLTPPANSDKAHRHVSAESEPVLGWRPALEQVVPGTHWVLEKKLGEGGFGEVWLGRHQTLKERPVFKFCFRAIHRSDSETPGSWRTTYARWANAAAAGSCKGQP